MDPHSSLILSPFKRITQQLTNLELKSPDIDEFATPCTPKNVEDMWNNPHCLSMFAQPETLKIDTKVSD